MHQGPRRNRQETRPKYKFHPLREGGVGMELRAGVGQAPVGQKGVGGYLCLTLLSVPPGLSSCETRTWGYIEV